MQYIENVTHKRKGKRSTRKRKIPKKRMLYDIPHLLLLFIYSIDTPERSLAAQSIIEGGLIPPQWTDAYRPHPYDGENAHADEFVSEDDSEETDPEWIPTDSTEDTELSTDISDEENYQSSADNYSDPIVSDDGSQLSRRKRRRTSSTSDNRRIRPRHTSSSLSDDIIVLSVNSITPSQNLNENEDLIGGVSTFPEPTSSLHPSESTTNKGIHPSFFLATLIRASDLY